MFFGMSRNQREKRWAEKAVQHAVVGRKRMEAQREDKIVSIAAACKSRATTALQEPIEIVQSENDVSQY
ncbi:CLUMA_CG021560, isoform A [Clunio marinus]|uniref:CLUMA_CG021560, isoform A n=1 Tax=Clunio marinus TaxID=568069 RepID=A0A1J1JC54_9DIPT|nr:CLUMA_CG021560, isoform A [Clunio marinus]